MTTNTRNHTRTLLGVLGIAALAFDVGPALAQVTLKSEDVTFRFGVQGQLWADWTQDSTAGSRGYQQNLYMRRGRLIMAGDIGKDISFFLETDSPNLGRTPKAATAGFMLQDAFLEWKPSKPLQIDGGLFLVPFSRNGLQSTLSYYTLDISPLATVANGATQSAGLRDLGFQARGFFLSDRLQYRAGVFQGARDANAHNSLRTAAYVQYNIYGTETGYVFAGTNLGKKKILALSAGTDRQGAYRGVSANITANLPIRGGDEIAGQFQFFHYDGRAKFPAIARQNDWFIESAYYVRKAKLQPFSKFETQVFSDSGLAARNSRRVSAGAHYYVHGQTLKWTMQYSRLLPHHASPLKPSNQLTLQLQLFYF